MILFYLGLWTLFSIPLLKSTDAQANFYGYIILLIAVIILFADIGYEAYIKETMKSLKIGDTVFRKFDDKGNVIHFKENSTEYLIKDIKERHVLLENTLSKGLIEESVHSINAKYKDSNFNDF
jgi:hypothetical protein